LAIEALSAIDIALWDLKGRYLGLPVHQLMGGPLRSRVQAYATGFYRKRGGDAVSYLIDEAQQRADAGFAAIKLKLGFGIGEDIRLCQSIRRAVGETMTIMVDANHAYDATAAIRVGRQIEELDIAWFEEPVPPEDLQGYRQVKSPFVSRSPGARPSLPAGAFDRSSSTGRSISCSPMFAPPAASPSARKSQTWRVRSGCASTLMCGEQGLA
jgi:L-alanine-DL-glutamate epimerase-like enolase superfamily enzyme